MVSSTLCPAVHILGSQNVYSRAEGIADHYWAWAVFFFCPSVSNVFALVFIITNKNGNVTESKGMQPHSECCQKKGK